MLSVRRRRDSVLRLALATVALTGFASLTRAQDAPTDSAAPLLPQQQTLGANAAPATDPGALPDLPDVSRPADVTQPKAKPVKKPLPRLRSRDLPALKPYPGAQRLGLRGGAADPHVGADGQPTSYQPPSPTVAQSAKPSPLRKIKREDDPYQPLGLRLGDVVVKPYVEQDVGYASNPLAASSGGPGSGFETTEAGASWQSDWSRNDFHGQLKGGFTDYFQQPQANAVYGSGVADARADATHDLSFDAEGRFSITPQSLSAFGLTSSGATNPDVMTSTYGGTAGANVKFGDLTLGLHGSFDRQQYENVALFGAALPGLSADDYDDWGGKFRVSYRLSEAVTPFVEAAYDQRLYDTGMDALGYQRNSAGYAARGGLTLNFSKLLIGEASLGYGDRVYHDPRLPRASTWLTDASLTWTPTVLTTVTAKAQTALNDSILAGASADINHTYTIDLAHSLTRVVTLGLTGSYAIDDDVGAPVHTTTAAATARAEFHVNRNVVIKASASRQDVASNQTGQSYIADVFMLGLKLQE